jgi:hypothetical protein
LIIAKQQFLDDELVDHTFSARQNRGHGQSGVPERAESWQPGGDRHVDLGNVGLSAAMDERIILEELRFECVFICLGDSMRSSCCQVY